MPFWAIGLAFAGFLIFFAVFNYFLISRYENKDSLDKEKATVPDNITNVRETGTGPQVDAKAATAIDTAKQNIKMRPIASSRKGLASQKPGLSLSEPVQVNLFQNRANLKNLDREPPVARRTVILLYTNYMLGIRRPYRLLVTAKIPG